MSCSRTISNRYQDTSVPPAKSPNTDFKTEIKTIHANMMMMVIVSGDDDDGVRGDINNDDDSEQGFKVARC